MHKIIREYSNDILGSLHFACLKVKQWAAGFDIKCETVYFSVEGNLPFS